MEQQRIEVLGKLGSTYGIRGWLRIYSSTEQAESIFDYQPWFLKIKGEWQPTELENWRHHNHEIIVKLKGVDDRETRKPVVVLGGAAAVHLDPLFGGVENVGNFPRGELGDADQVAMAKGIAAGRIVAGGSGGCACH